MGKWKSVEGNVVGLVLPTSHCQRDPCAGCGRGSARAPSSGMRGWYFDVNWAHVTLLSQRVPRLVEAAILRILIRDFPLLKI